MKLSRIYFNRNEEDQLASKRNSTLLQLIRPRKIRKSNWALFLPREDVTLPLKQANFSIFYHIIIYYYPFFLNNFLGYLLLTECKKLVIKKVPFILGMLLRLFIPATNSSTLTLCQVFCYLFLRQSS